MFAEWKDSIISIIKEYLRENIYGPIPGIVVAVSDYTDRQTVDVEIGINRKYVSGKIVLEGGSTIYGVPFVNPGSGGAVTTYPVKVGDNVLLVFGMRDLTDWKDSDGSSQVTPSEPRYMSSTDAIAIPGICTIHNHLSPSADNAEMKFKDNILSMQPDNTIVLSNGVFSLTISPDGTAVMTNGNVTYTMNADGSTSESNGSGTKTLSTNGTFNFNGFIINPDGSASSPVSVIAPTVSGTSSLLAAGAEVVRHTHSGVESGSSSTNPLV